MIPRRLCLKAFFLCASLTVAVPSYGAPPEDWSTVPVHQVRLFYPGQASYQWLRSADHGGRSLVEQGGACLACHEGDEIELGKSLVAGGALEPHPVPGKRPVLSLSVQAAYDEENAYLRFRWRTQNPLPGLAHPHWRFNGSSWNRYGAPRLHPDVWREGEPAIYEDRLSLMLDDGSVPMFAEQGCWLSCHDGMRDMPDEPSADEVRAQPLLGKTLNKSDVRKYLPDSRTDDEASWNATKLGDEIADIMEQGLFVDLMQWRAHRSNPVGMADDGYVLEYRLFDAGRSMFAGNWNGAVKRPEYMFDEAKVGFRSLRAEDLSDPAKVVPLILDENAHAFDPALDWKDGEVIPEYYLTRSEASGSAADNAEVTGTWQDGAWTVVWVRPLDTGHSDDKVLKPGGTVTVGFAVHDDNITTRGHHVSFPLTLGIGVQADITAIKIE